MINSVVLGLVGVAKLACLRGTWVCRQEKRRKDIQEIHGKERKYSNKYARACYAAPTSPLGMLDDREGAI